jgi:hypothetical protein
MRSAVAMRKIEAGSTSIGHSNGRESSTVPTTTRAKITIRTTITTSASVALSWPTPSTFIQFGSLCP